MADKKDETVAKAIHAHLQDNMRSTVDEISEKIDAPTEQVVRVMDTFMVDENGKISKTRPGQGGGWLTEDQLRTLHGI